MRRKLGSSDVVRLIGAVLVVAAAAGAKAGGASEPARESAFSLRGTIRLPLGASSGGDYRIEVVRRESPTDSIFSDDFESGDLTAWAPPWGMPSGTVAFFDRATCPSGWNALAAARGRALVGLPLAGVAAGTNGVPLADLDTRWHLHLFSYSTALGSAAGHSHSWSWSSTAAGTFDWFSYDANGNGTLLFEWSNGVGNEGSGIYPFTTDAGRYFGVAYQSGHSHLFNVLNLNSSTASATAPYLQLLACRKT